MKETLSMCLVSQGFRAELSREAALVEGLHGLMDKSHVSELCDNISISPNDAEKWKNLRL